MRRIAKLRFSVRPALSCLPIVALLNLLTPAVAAVTDSAALSPYQAGLDGRKAVEAWFGALPTGDYRNGAVWWAGQRNLAAPATCDSLDSAGTPDFINGCEAAKQIFSEDVKNRRFYASNPELLNQYKQGWNAYATAPESKMGAGALVEAKNTPIPTLGGAPPPIDPDLWARTFLREHGGASPETAPSQHPSPVADGKSAPLQESPSQSSVKGHDQQGIPQELMNLEVAVAISPAIPIQPTHVSLSRLVKILDQASGNGTWSEIQEGQWAYTVVVKDKVNGNSEIDKFLFEETGPVVLSYSPTSTKKVTNAVKLSGMVANGVDLGSQQMAVLATSIMMIGSASPRDVGDSGPQPIPLTVPQRPGPYKVPGGCRGLPKDYKMYGPDGRLVSPWDIGACN